jgi:hypothetical protein
MGQMNAPLIFCKVEAEVFLLTHQIIGSKHVQPTARDFLRYRMISELSILNSHITIIKETPTVSNIDCLSIYKRFSEINNIKLTDQKMFQSGLYKDSLLNYIEKKFQ